MAPGEIYLAMFPFGDAPGMKLRPVLTLTGPVGPIPEILVAYISSVIPSQILPSDILLDPSRLEHKSANLKVPFVIRLHKLATIHTRSLVRQLGIMPSQLTSDVSVKLRSLLNI
jgi:mRNA interferase MazF